MQSTTRHYALNYLAAKASPQDILALCLKTEARTSRDDSNWENLTNFVSSRGLCGNAVLTTDQTVIQEAVEQQRPLPFVETVAQPRQATPKRKTDVRVIKRSSKVLRHMRRVQCDNVNSVAYAIGCTWDSAKKALEYLVSTGAVKDRSGVYVVV